MSINGIDEEEERSNQKKENSETNKNNNSNKKVPYLKLFSFADRLDVVLMILGVVGAIGNGMSAPLMTLFLGDVINSFGSNTESPSRMMHDVSKVALKYVYLGIGSAVAALLQSACWMATGERQASRIRGLYLKAILGQDIEFFDTETSTGEVIGRMSGDTILIQEAMSDKVGKFIQFASTFIGGFAISFARGWLLSLILCACLPFIMASGAIMAIVMSKMAGLGQAAYADAGNILEQTVGGIRTVASFTGEKLAIEKYNRKLQAAYAATVKQGLVSGTGIGFVLLCVFSSYGLAIWAGSRLILYHGYNGGIVINVMVAIMMGGMSLGQIAPCLSAFAQGQAAAYKMFATINRKPRIDAYETSGLVLDDMEGVIDLKDVYFKYPARPDVQIFSGFSLHVPAGTTAALVGQSGSGKSTVISLLERFYDPDAGEVLIDGVNLKKLRLNWLRGKVGLVSQEPILFGTTIKENILYGNVNATEAEIRNAIELANAAKFIDKLPNGLDTMVGEHGAQLSGGQKQRIAISRAMLKNPKILLLDEATSALDAESERVVQEALDRVMVNRTTVVVAHRLTTVRNADLIAVVHAGKLVEKGTHSELIKDPNGAYSQLVRMQEGSQKDERAGQQSLEKKNLDMEIDEVSGRSSSHRISFRRSTSKGSSRRSFTLSFGVPSFVEIQEADESGHQETEENSLDAVKRSSASIKRLAYLNKPEALHMLIGSIAACINGLIFPIFGLIMAKAIRILYEPPNELRKNVAFWALMYAGMGLLSLLVLPVQNYLFGIAGGKLIQRVRSLSFEKVVHQEISWFDDPKNSSGAVGARLSSDASTLRNLVGDALALIVQNISTVVTGLLLSFTANWKLALVVLASLPLVGLQGFSQMKFRNGYGGDAKAMYEEASQVANDAVGSIRTVASFCAEDKVLEMYKKKCDGPIKSGVRLGLISGAGLAAGNFFTYCSNAACFYIGALLVRHGEATFGQVFRVFFSLTMAATGISQTAGLAPDISKAKASAVSIFGILDRRSKIDSSSNDGLTLERVNGDIELKHVSFKYPIRPDIQIFKELSLSIHAGKMVALVGESGSGKSTIISLIERFYDPDSGQIFLDGVETRRLKISWLRQQMGLVSQEPTLFNETIRANVAYGKQGTVVTEEEIIAATKAANAHNFISSLPQGYDTNVGERGIQLSGGQKQRIAIARAILKNPRILLLDEATSALDAESERIVQDALDNVSVNRTTVVVAHRLSTIRGADVIAVVKNGAISEKGRHEALMQIPNGMYASMVALHSSAE